MLWCIIYVHDKQESVREIDQKQLRWNVLISSSLSMLHVHNIFKEVVCSSMSSTLAKKGNSLLSNHMVLKEMNIVIQVSEKSFLIFMSRWWVDVYWKKGEKTGTKSLINLWKIYNLYMYQFEKHLVRISTRRNQC